MYVDSFPLPAKFKSSLTASTILFRTFHVWVSSRLLRALTRLCTGWLTREQPNDRKQPPQKAPPEFKCDPIEGNPLKRRCCMNVSANIQCVQANMKDLLVPTSWHSQLNSKGSQQIFWMAQREKSFWWILRDFWSFMRIETVCAWKEGNPSSGSISLNPPWLPRSKDNWRNPV